MIEAHMIAPCGLDCKLCSRHLQADHPCPGCNGPDGCKPDCCRVDCAIVHCAVRKTLPGGFCDACVKFPCADVMEKETRYSNAYPMVETPIGNLAYIRKCGMDAFLKQERRRWSCPDCGGIICVHDGVCSGCGGKYTTRIPVRSEGK